MASANNFPRPCSESTQDLRFMGAIVFPTGEILSTPSGEFLFPHADDVLQPMVIVEETRRKRLQMLVTQFGSMASLCEALGYARTETAGLTRILNANIRHDRDGQPYRMGSPMARQIEEKLSLDLGWMDTPPSHSELYGEDDPRTKVLQLMEGLPPDQWSTIVRLVDAVAQPTKSNGTSGKQ